MPSARQPAAGLRDRAERHVFEALPELPAVERRLLALLELAEVEIGEAAAELGIDPETARRAAWRARKALRRGRAPLAAGARCERAERLMSDRSFAPLPREDRRWLEIHLARCGRCERHAEALDAAASELREAFTAPPKPAAAPPEAPEPEAPPTPVAARLRVVPPTALAEPAPDLPAPEPGRPVAFARPRRRPPRRADRGGRARDPRAARRRGLRHLAALAGQRADRPVGAAGCARRASRAAQRAVGRTGTSSESIAARAAAAQAAPSTGSASSSTYGTSLRSHILRTTASPPPCS